MLVIHRSPSLCPGEFNKKSYKFLENFKHKGTLNLFNRGSKYPIIERHTYWIEYLNILNEYGYPSGIILITM